MANQELIQQLLRERDAQYRRAQKAEAILEKYADVAALEAEWERTLAEVKAMYEKAMAEEKVKHEKAMTEEKANHAKEILKINAESEAKLQKTVKEYEEKLRVYVNQLEYLKRRVWGSMSEKRQAPDDPLQLRLDLGDLGLTDEEKKLAEDAAEKIKQARKTITVKEHTKQVPVRKKLPEGLRHEEVHIYPEGYEGHEDEWILFSETEDSEHLEVTAPDVWVRVTKRHKGIRKADMQIVTAKAPAEPIAKSYASASLLTELMVGKYVDHLPFYRQINMFKRLGVDLKQPTIEEWFHEVADLMRPTYFRLRDIMLQTDYLQSDESTLPIINNEKHRTVKGYIWLARSAILPLVLFHYHDGSRGQEVATGFFKDFKGALQVDGYGAYDILDKMEGITILCCWAHARRYFDRALTNDKERAEHALEQIGMLYSVETMADADGLDYAGRAALRQELAYPIITALEAWALKEYDEVLPKSPIGKALHYLTSHIRQLSRYVTDGRYQIDNNLIENSVRPLAIGRKNFLFCGNHNAAEDAAVIYTFMGCCKLAEVDFRKWTNYFLSHIHEYDNSYALDLADFLPHNMKAKGIL